MSAQRFGALRRLLHSAAVGVLALSATGAFAQSWPTRPVRIVVPFSAGGTTDVLVRLIAAQMTQDLGQSVVVDNRPGVGGLLGADHVAKADPDGYTLLMANISFPLAVLMAARENRLNFDPQADLQGVSIVAAVPMVLTAAASVSANNLKEFTDLARSHALHLRFHRAGLIHARDGCLACAGNRRTAHAHPLQRRSAVKAKHAGRAHPFGRRPAIDFAGRNSRRVVKGHGGYVQQTLA